MFRILGVVLLVSLVASPAIGKNYLLKLKSPRANLLAHTLNWWGVDVPGHGSKDGYFEVVTEQPDRVKKLARDLGFSFEVISTIPSESYRNFAKRQSVDSVEEYFDPIESHQALIKLEKQYPEWAKVYNLNEWLGVEKTLGGRVLYALQVSGTPEKLEDEPKVVFIAQHHARELMTHHAVIDAAADLLKRVKAQEAEAVQWVKESSVWFVPVVNPDGLAYVFDSDRMWRKNRAKNSNGSRGVDLNRNYEFKWGECGNNSSNGWSAVYRGPKANSEPEVKVMDRLNNLLRAQFLISYHSSGDEVLYPYKCGTLAETQVYHSLRDELAQTLGFGKRYASSSGEDFEHHYARYGSLAFLLEIGDSFQPSFSKYRTTVWPSVKKTLPFVMRKLHSQYVHIRVRDQRTKRPVSAAIELKEIVFQEGETRSADRFGSYRWHLKPGKYHLKASLTGYTSTEIVFEATGGVDTVDVVLQPE